MSVLIEISKSRSATLAKGLQILDFIALQNGPVLLRQVTAELEMTKPTAHRLLATLADYGLVRFDPTDNTYSLGMRLFELSRQVWQDFDLRSSVITEMQKLSRETGETVSLAILTPDGGVYIDEVQSNHQIREQSRIGQRVSYWKSAVGKALISGLSIDERAALLEANKNEIRENSTFKDLQKLNSHLDLVNARGYATEIDDDIPGISSVAAPILDHRGITVAAISLSGSSQRLTRDELHNMGPAVIEATRLASLKAGGAPRPVSSNVRPKTFPEPNVDIIYQARNLIGEGLTLSLDGQFVYWVDICSPCVFSLCLKSGEVKSFPQDEMITAISDSKIGLLVAGQSGIKLFDKITGKTYKTISDPESDRMTNRYNDGKCDSKGRFWVNSLAFNLEPKAGALYCIDPNGLTKQMDTGITLPNGMGWSLNNKIMYLVDTSERVIYAYDFDENTGEIDNRKILINFSDECLGNPDGMDVDKDGNLWVAMWDGWSIRKYSPDGEFKEAFSMPFPRPTSCLFLEGETNRVLVTSARIRISENLLKEFPLAGSLVSIPLNQNTN